MYIAEILERWYELNKRDLPWRNTRSAYQIWISEIILQQTRVNQGIDYYNRFVKAFPTVADLAGASLDEVMKLWQGLGYYTRARNMHQTAQIINEQHGGFFPSDYNALLALKGIGAYTAAAIASIAFDIPISLVDGNVSRVLARLYAIDVPVDSSAGKKVIANIAGEMLNAEKPGIHNQALMEFGALVCLPMNPRCDVCVLRESCLARKSGLVEKLPVKKQKKISRDRYFNYIIIKDSGYTYIKKRTGRDIWHSLYEFPLYESAQRISANQLMNSSTIKLFFTQTKYTVLYPVKSYRHLLTHQTLICSFTLVDLQSPISDRSCEYIKVPIAELNKYAIPRIIEVCLNEFIAEGLL